MATRCPAAVPSSSSSIIRSRWPASMRRAARRLPGRSSPPPASSTATNFRAGSTISRTCRSTSARRSTRRLVKCAAWGVGIATVEEIDTINIYWARMLAMTRAVEALGLEPAWVLVDGNACPRWQRPSKAIVDGDAKCRSIARRLDHRQGHPRPDHGRLCARISGLRLGDIIAATATPDHRRALQRPRTRPRCTAEASAGARNRGSQGAAGAASSKKSRQASPLSHTTSS